MYKVSLSTLAAKLSGDERQLRNGCIGVSSEVRWVFPVLNDCR